MAIDSIDFPQPQIIITGQKGINVSTSFTRSVNRLPFKRDWLDLGHDLSYTPSFLSFLQPFFSGLFVYLIHFPCVVHGSYYHRCHSHSHCHWHPFFRPNKHQQPIITYLFICFFNSAIQLFNWNSAIFEHFTNFELIRLPHSHWKQIVIEIVIIWRGKGLSGVFSTAFLWTLSIFTPYLCVS